MPKIPVYSNNLFPDPSPLARAAGSAEKTGYYIGQMREQAWNSLGRGVQSAFSALTKEGALGGEDKLAAQQEVATLTGGVAEATANLTTEWQQTLATSDPAKVGETQSNFLEKNFKETFDKLGTDLTTDKGRMYYEKAKTRAFAHFYTVTSTDTANATARYGVDQAGKIYTSNSNAIVSDPTSWHSIITQSDEAVDALDSVHSFGAQKKQELKDKFNHDYAETAAKQMVYDDPEIGSEAVRNGDFDKFLDGNEKAVLLKSAEDRAHAMHQDQLTSDAAELAERKNIAHQQLNELQESVPMNADGTFAVPKNFPQQLDAIVKANGDVITPSEARSVRNWAATETRRALKSIAGVAHSDPRTDMDLAVKLAHGDLTEQQVMDARADGKLSVTGFKHYIAAVNKSPSDRREITDARKFLSAKKMFIMHTAIGYEDTLGADRFQDYQDAMLEKYQEFKDKGKSAKEWQEYAAKAVDDYKFSEQDLDQILGTMGGSDLVPPTQPRVTPPTAIEQIKPGESLDDYDKRTSP